MDFAAYRAHIVGIVMGAIAIFYSGCAAEKPAVNNTDTAIAASAPVRKVPLRYRCSSCGKEISRDETGGGFIAKCPYCGKPFLTM